MKQTSFHAISEHRGSPRFWLEGDRLTQLGFTPDTMVRIDRSGPGFVIIPALLGDRKVSSKAAANGRRRPIIDLNSRTILSQFVGIDQAKAVASVNRIDITPSIRSANILRGRQGRSCYRVLDIFGGGSTTADAFTHNPRFQSVGVVEIERQFADEYGRKHPNAEIFLGDFRQMDVTELPEFDGLVAGIPCVDHSCLGRAKKSLAGCPELGPAGDLYIPVLALVAARMPAFVVLENVAAFGGSLAGLTICDHLRKLGYSVDDSIIRPNSDYNEPTTRNRWVCFATLKPGFKIPNPHTAFSGAVADYLDAPDSVRDREDAERIADSIAYLRRHNAEHAAKGNRFAMKILTGAESSCPTLTKSYHKLNSTGAFIATPFGPRAIRPEEFCRLNGHTFTADNYSTTIYQMSGQGVLTRVFRTLFNALGEFLP